MYCLIGDHVLYSSDEGHSAGTRVTIHFEDADLVMMVDKASGKPILLCCDKLINSSHIIIK